MKGEFIDHKNDELVGGNGELERRLRASWVVQVEAHSLQARLAQPVEVVRGGRGAGS